MQQTENLKLNLIETGDPISPAPINENAEKIEAALTSGLAAARAEAAAGDAALDARVQVLELHKFVCGTYIGNTFSYGGSQIIDLGFTPAAVVVSSISTRSAGAGICVQGHPVSVVEIVANGFKVTNYSDEGVSSSANAKDYKYSYIAFV